MCPVIVYNHNIMALIKDQSFSYNDLSRKLICSILCTMALRLMFAIHALYVWPTFMYGDIVCNVKHLYLKACQIYGSLILLSDILDSDFQSLFMLSEL